MSHYRFNARHRILGIPPELLEKALSPELHRKTRATCCYVWPWWFLSFVLVVWVLAKQGVTTHLDGKYSAQGPDAVQRPRSLLAAMLDRWTQRIQAERPPTPKELLPKDRTSLWLLGDLARQIKQASNASELNTAPALSTPQEHLKQLQQQAASLMSASLPAEAMTPQLFDQMLGALDVWEKTESLQARLRGFFSLGTLIYCLGILGILAFSLPVARLVGIKILRLAYTIIPKVLERLKLKRVLEDIGPKLVVALVRVHYALLMPVYPGLGLLPSVVLISAARYQRPTAGVLLVLSAIALAVLNLVVVLRIQLIWHKWLRKWILMQPLLAEIPPEHAEVLAYFHGHHRSPYDNFWAELEDEEEFWSELEDEEEFWSEQPVNERRAARPQARLEQERQLSYLRRPVNAITTAASSPYPGYVQKFWFTTLFILCLSAPLARAHSSLCLGFVASGALFLAAIMGFVAVGDTCSWGPRRTTRTSLQDGYILGKGPGPAFAASLLVLVVRGVAYALGVSQELAPFRVGFNVFGCMATLAVSHIYSWESVSKRWASKQGLPEDKVCHFFKIFYYTLLAMVIAFGATLDKSGAFFSIGCIDLVLNLCSGLVRRCASTSRALTRLLVSVLLCGAGWFIHAHPEFLAHALGASAQ